MINKFNIRLLILIVLITYTSALLFSIYSLDTSKFKAFQYIFIGAIILGGTALIGVLVNLLKSKNN